MKVQVALIVTLISLFSLSVQSDPVVKLNELMSAMSTLQVDFSLEIRNQDNNELIDNNTGKLTVKRPGFFHVHTREPFEQLLISDQQVIWSYDVELEQATREAVDERLQQTPFLLLSGDAEAIRANFTIQEPVLNGDNESFKLSPLDINASYSNVELRFKNKILNTMLWTNTLGEKAQIEFSNIEVNPSIDDSLFNFTPPAGVDVVLNDAQNSSNSSF